jgi:chromosome partitioning protein
MVISIVNHKGGTGKTTTTINLGRALTMEGKRILLIDLDTQGNLTYSLGEAEASPTIAELLLGEASTDQVLKKCEGVHLLPANETLADVELTLARLDERFHHLKNLVSSLSSYDFILIDCPPSLSLLTINALTASDYIIVPMQMDVLALRGLDSILNTVEKVQPLNANLTVLGILPVMVDPRKNIHQEIINHIKSNYFTRLFNSAIRICVKVAEAPSFGKSVLKYAPTCSAARDYTSFAKEVLSMTEVDHAHHQAYVTKNITLKNAKTKH